MAEGGLRTREEVIAALRDPGRLPFFKGRVVDVIPRDEDFLLVVHEQRLDEVVAFEYQWSDDDTESFGEWHPEYAWGNSGGASTAAGMSASRTPLCVAADEHRPLLQSTSSPAAVVSHLAVRRRKNAV